MKLIKLIKLIKMSIGVYLSLCVLGACKFFKSQSQTESAAFQRGPKPDSRNAPSPKTLDAPENLPEPLKAIFSNSIFFYAETMAPGATSQEKIHATNEVLLDLISHLTSSMPLFINFITLEHITLKHIFFDASKYKPGTKNFNRNITGGTFVDILIKTYEEKKMVASPKNRQHVQITNTGFYCKWKDGFPQSEQSLCRLHKYKDGEYYFLNTVPYRGKNPTKKDFVMTFYPVFDVLNNSKIIID